MIFIFKQKPIHLDCFTANISAYANSPIAPAINFIPDWWKQLPKSYMGNELNEVGTMRTCAGFVDLYGKGLMIPMWTDVRIKHNDNNSISWQFSDGVSTLAPHDPRQIGNTFLIDSSSVHAKLISPWAFKCKEEIYWSFTQAVWNQQAGKDFCVLSGIVDYKYQHTTHVNIFVRQKSDFLISCNSPMGHVVPLSERPFKIHNHLISVEEFDRYDKPRNIFVGSFYKNKRILQTKPKCPFNF